MPYWGMRGGDLIAWLRGKGYQAFAASVAPVGSLWDRACELYAQLAGNRVDYGAAHSREYRHERYGRDFTGRPLIPSFDANTKLVLIGHSFGGATANLFAELMANGDAREREATDAAELSPCSSEGWARESNVWRRSRPGRTATLPMKFQRIIGSKDKMSGFHGGADCLIPVCQRGAD